jgi:hypothetical protein
MTGRITIIWDITSGTERPEGIPNEVVRVERCTACGEKRLTWEADKTHGWDPWKKHFDYCEEGTEVE